MACFLVPTAEAIITTTVSQIMKSKETPKTLTNNGENGELETVEKVSLSKKVGWLSKLLWGGSALIAFEHVWHGEITAVFPFLTAASNPTDFAAMLGEMSTVGVSMAVLITAVWGGMMLAAHAMEKKATKILKKAE